MHVVTMRITMLRRLFVPGLALLGWLRWRVAQALSLRPSPHVGGLTTFGFPGSFLC